jgi:sugar (pentulose or hexulose) kinase
MSNPHYLGIDLGTGGVRCLLVDGRGSVVSESRCDLESENTADRERASYSEQSPEHWNKALNHALLHLDHLEKVVAIAVDSTSGTVLPVDASTGVPLHNALLYNDRRSGQEASRCTEVLGETISPTFGLPKILWMKNHLDLPERTRFLHAADYFNEQLTGTAVATDFTNAMKSGVDLDTLAWPEAIESVLGLPLSQLPEVRKPGDLLGLIDPGIAARFKISPSARVFAGATDSNAAFYASGAGKVGEWCHTIGTTFALKGISSQKIDDPQSRIYNHRHPDGHWLPGGASNCGGEILKQHFSGKDLARLDRAARERSTTDHLVYPLARRGDRLPFSGEEIDGFIVGDGEDEVGLYLGCLEGVAFIERLTIELLEELGATVGQTIFATGGGAKSDLWLQIRANVTGRTMAVPKSPESAYGAAILAAAGHLGQSVGETSRQMVRLEKKILPNQDPDLTTYYESKYERFKAECSKRKF